MIFYRSIISLTVLLFCSFCCRAQDSNYVYQDTALLYADSVAASAGEELDTVQNNEDETTHEYIADTILRNNQLLIEPDSVRTLKNSKSFAYAKNLDSLLSDYQRSLKNEEVSTKKHLSWFARFLLAPFTSYFFLLLAGVFIFAILYKLFLPKVFFSGHMPALTCRY